VYEDTDFCFRAKKYGFRTYYSPKAIAYHMLSTDPKDEIDRLLSRAYWVGRNRVIFMKKFGNNFVVFLMFLPIFITYYFSKSIKNKRIIDGFKFLQGTFAGIIE
jgi:GT2 family glycosyltransferase